MENINTALLTRYLEAQDKIAQQQIQIQKYQDEIKDLSRRIRSLDYDESIINYHLDINNDVKKTAKTLNILETTVKMAPLKRRIYELEQKLKREGYEEIVLQVIRDQLKDARKKYDELMEQETAEVYRGID